MVTSSSGARTAVLVIVALALGVALLDSTIQIASAHENIYEISTPDVTPGTEGNGTIVTGLVTIQAEHMMPADTAARLQLRGLAASFGSDITLDMIPTALERVSENRYSFRVEISGLEPGEYTVSLYVFQTEGDEMGIWENWGPLTVFTVQADRSLPTMLIHGWNNSACAWPQQWYSGLNEVARPNGCVLHEATVDDWPGSGSVYVFDYSTHDSATGDILDYRDALGTAIEEVKSREESDEVFLVAHSMGGLVARAYMANRSGSSPYQGDVAGLLTLDTPHRGSYVGDQDLGLGELLSRFWVGGDAAQQMDPDSTFILELNQPRDDEAPLVCEFVVGNHYPLFGDGLLTIQEQYPPVDVLRKWREGGEGYITFVDAVHSESIAEQSDAALWVGTLGFVDVRGDEGQKIPIQNHARALEVAKSAYERCVLNEAGK